MKVPPLESVCTISKTEARIEITPKIVMRLTGVSLRARSKSSCCSANMLIFVLTSETKVGVCNLKRKCGAIILHSKGFRFQGDNDIASEFGWLLHGQNSSRVPLFNANKTIACHKGSRKGALGILFFVLMIAGKEDRRMGETKRWWKFVRK